MFKNSAIKKYSKTIIILILILYLATLGFYAYDTRRESSLFQKGMQIRNSYSDFRIEKIDGGVSYSRFPHRLFEIKADENTLYSYRDDFYKLYSDSDTTIDRNKIVIYLTQRQIFDDPVVVGQQP